VDRKASASTQNQALSAILFMYRNLLNIELDDSVLNFVRPKRGKRVPTVLSAQEARAFIARLIDPYKLMVQLLYGSGLRMECLRLRVKDLDFDNRRILVYDGKGGDDRITMRPIASLPRSGNIWLKSEPSTKKTCLEDWAPCIFQMDWLRNIRRLRNSGSGSMSFLHLPSLRIQKRE
jgi:integrase